MVHNLEQTRSIGRGQSAMTRVSYLIASVIVAVNKSGIRLLDSTPL